METCFKHKTSNLPLLFYILSQTFSHGYNLISVSSFLVIFCFCYFTKMTSAYLRYDAVSISPLSSYQYKKSNCGDKTILRLSYLHNGISYTGKTTSLYWIGAWVCRSYLTCYNQTSNIRRTLAGNKIVDHSDVTVVGASPVGDASTTSSFST